MRKAGLEVSALPSYTFNQSDEISKALNELARHELKLKILQDIRADISVCLIEGWDYKEYLIDLRSLIDSFLNEKIERV